MKPVVFLIFLIGVGAMIQRTVDFSSEESSFSAIAVNYAIYRNEVFRYVYENNANIVTDSTGYSAIMGKISTESKSLTFW